MRRTSTDFNLHTLALSSAFRPRGMLLAAQWQVFCVESPKETTPDSALNVANCDSLLFHFPD